MFLFTPSIFLSGLDKIADNSVCDQMAKKEQKTVPASALNEHLLRDFSIMFNWQE